MTPDCGPTEGPEDHVLMRSQMRNLTIKPTIPRIAILALLVAGCEIHPTSVSAETIESTNEDVFGLVGAVLAAFSVLIPFVISWVERRSRLNRSMHLIKLIKAHDDLKEIRIEKKNEAPAAVLAKVDSLINAIEAELSGASRLKLTMEPFLFVVAVEVLLLLGVIFLGLSDQIDLIMSKESWESGVTFFEGIFKYRTTRLLLLMSCIGLAVFSATLAGKYIREKLDSALLYNAIMWASCHVAFVVLALLGATVLYVLDDIISLF